MIKATPVPNQSPASLVKGLRDCLLKNAEGMEKGKKGFPCA